MKNNEILKFTRSMMLLYEQTVSPLAQKHQLAQLELDILAFLNNNPDLDTASHIVEYRMLPKANVSQAVDGLTRKGLLSARRDEADRRRVHLSPTAAAAGIITEIIAAQRSFQDMMFADFSEEERRMYDEMTLRISENAKKRLEKK